jgi:DNA repair exonuclease SbcCD ATPase subunit
VIETRRALLDQAREQASRLEARVQHAEECEEAARLYQSLQEKIAICNQRLTRLPVVKERYERLGKCQDTLKGLKSRLSQLEGADQALALMMKNEVAKKNLWHQLEDDPTRDALEAWQARKAALDVQEAQAGKAMETLQETSEDAPCPTCKHPLSRHRREERVEHLRVWLDQELPQLLLESGQEKEGIDRSQEAWREERARAQKAWDEAREAVAGAQQRVYEWNLLRKQHDTAMEELQAAQKAWDELREDRPYDPREEQRVESKRNELTQKALKLQEDADLFSRLPELREELQEKEDEVEGYGQKIKEHQVRQSEIGYDPTAHEAATQAFSDAEKTLSETKAKLQGAKLETERRTATAQKEGEAVERAERVRRRLEDDIAEFWREDRLLTLLGDFLNYFFEANTKRVSQRASELILHAVTDGSILGVEFDEQGRLYYLDASYARRLVTKTRPSGGEKALIGLCLRIALAEQAQSIARTGKLRFLVLDEVLSSLDDERRDAVEQIFEDVQQRGVFEHIIMITHLDAVKQGWRANGLEVRKVGTKESKVAPVKMGEAVSDLAEEYEEV